MSSSLRTPCAGSMVSASRLIPATEIREPAGAPAIISCRSPGAPVHSKPTVGRSGSCPNTAVGGAIRAGSSVAAAPIQAS